jgi:hypothetical protein
MALLPAAAGCCALIAAPQPAAAGSAQSCAPAGSRTIAQSPYARVYREAFRGEREGRTIACVRRTGRRFALDDPDRLDNKVAIAGTTVVYSLQRSGGAEGFSEALIQLDMARAERRVLATADDGGGAIVAFFPNGAAVVWSRLGGEVWIRDANGSRLLEGGPGVSAGSLGIAANGLRAFWTNGGEARSVALPKGDPAYGYVPRSSRCNPRGSVTLSQSTHARVYRTRVAQGVGPSFACWLKTGRRVQLDDPASGGPELLANPASGTAPSGIQPRLEGRFLVFTLFVTDGESEVQTLQLLDVSTGRRTGLGGFNADEERPVAFVLDRAGHVAFTLTDDRERDEVWYYRDGAKQLVESGPGVDSGSLAIGSDRERFYWSSGDAPLSRDLR